MQALRIATIAATSTTPYTAILINPICAEQYYRHHSKQPALLNQHHYRATRLVLGSLPPLLPACRHPPSTPTPACHPRGKPHRTHLTDHDQDRVDRAQCFAVTRCCARAAAFMSKCIQQIMLREIFVVQSPPTWEKNKCVLELHGIQIQTQANIINDRS